MQFSCNEDSFMEEAEDEVAMFTNFMGGSITSKLDQNIKILIKN